MDKRGHITIFSRNFYVSQCRKLSKGNPTVFEKIFGFKKFYGWKGGITFFRRKFLVSQCRKISWASFNVSGNLGYRKILCILGGITFLRRKFLVSLCRKFSWASFNCFIKFGVSKNFMHSRVYHVFPSKIFGLTVPKNFVKEPFSVSLISGIKKC